jgi:GNAT superfamily N-acetyltransferase
MKPICWTETASTRKHWRRWSPIRRRSSLWPSVTAGLAYLGMLSVAPHDQGQGTGRALIAAAEATARDRFGASRMEMTVIIQRTELIDWYVRRGYRRTGETRPFPATDPRFGLPRRDDLAFAVLERDLACD